VSVVGNVLGIILYHIIYPSIIIWLTNTYNYYLLILGNKNNQYIITYYVSLRGICISSKPLQMFKIVKQNLL